MKKKVFVFLFMAGIALGFYVALSRNDAHAVSVASTIDGQPTDVLIGRGDSCMSMPRLVRGQRGQVITHTAFTVCWNADWNIPNWVAYELLPSETDGDEKRKESFEPDPQVVGERIVHKDYKNDLGYDRGHIAPAADMKWNKQAMRESFYTSNICPQNHNLNSGDWKHLEEYVRLCANTFGGLWVVSGPIVNGTDFTIGNDRKIVVPEAFYKVLLVQVDGQHMGIAFVMKNKPRDGKWSLSHYAVTIDSVESLTGIDFFSDMDDEVEQTFEGGYDVTAWMLQDE